MVSLVMVCLHLELFCADDVKNYRTVKISTGAHIETQNLRTT